MNHDEQDGSGNAFVWFESQPAVLRLRFSWLQQLLQVNALLVPHIRQGQLPTTPTPNHHSLVILPIDDMQTDQEKSSLMKS
jgi:hypothetical protein